MRNRYIAAMVVLSLILVAAQPRLAVAQTGGRPDPRGLDRYTLTSETSSLTVFSLPAYNGRSDFFDGWSRQTAERLGFAEAEFWNEFGRVARKGYLHGKAVIRIQNGFSWTGSEWIEGYLEGCTKRGAVYFNRIKIRVPQKPQVQVVKELCSNIAIAVEDVPRDWTVNRTGGKVVCTWPTPAPERIEVPVEVIKQEPCIPGQAYTHIATWGPYPKGAKSFEKSSAYSDVVDENLKDNASFKVREVLSQIDAKYLEDWDAKSFGDAEVRYLRIMQDRCADSSGLYRVYVEAFGVKGGKNFFAKYWKWMLLVAGAAIGAYIIFGRRGDGDALKTLPPGGIIRPRTGF